MTSKKKSSNPAVILNRRARHDYQLKQIYQAGIILTGPEVQSLRHGHGHLRGAYVNIKLNELWLFNATITATNSNRNDLKETDQTRARKLLVNRKEINQLIAAKEQGLSIIPTKILINKKYIKIEIATGRGLKKYDKRQKLKQRDSERAIHLLLQK